MAAGGVTTSSGRLTCPVCLEKYRRPKLLPCFHTFCQTCLESLAPPPAPSLTCPACRKVVVLPPGGVAEFQSNFYLEEDLANEAARECDICSESRSAEYRCAECQQYYCTPCRSLHEKMTACKHHNMIPFSAASATQQDRRSVARKCAKHDFQREVFFCTTCGVAICPHCKLTSHEGHLTDDLSDSGLKARQELQKRLREIQERLHLLETKEAETRSESRKLEADYNSADDIIKKRTDDVIKWAELAREEALGGAEKLRHMFHDFLLQKMESIMQKISSLSASVDYITRVLFGEDDNEVIKLLADMKSRDASSVEAANDSIDQSVLAEREGSSQDDGTCDNDLSHFLLVHQENDNVRSAIISYTGHVSTAEHWRAFSPTLLQSAQTVVSVPPTSGSEQSEPFEDAVENQEDAATAETETSAKVSKYVAALSSKVAIARSLPLIQGGFTDVTDPYTVCLHRQPLPEREIQNLKCASNSDTIVTAMCLTVCNKLWVKCKPPQTHVDILKLFDTNGALLGSWNTTCPKGNSLTCVGDTLLSPLDWCWLKPTGESGCLEKTPNDWALCSKSLPPCVVLFDNTLQAYKVYRLCVRSLHPLEVALVEICEQGDKLCGKPSEFDACCGGTVFSFMYANKVLVYCVNGISSNPVLVKLADYSMDGRSYINDLSFLNHEGKDVLVVIRDRKIAYSSEVTGHELLVFDHEDGFCIKFSERGDTKCTKVIAPSGTCGWVWLGDKGGQVRVKDLAKEIEW